MEYENAKEYILAKPEAKELRPSGSDVPVFKVCHKLFASLLDEDDETLLNLKCDPDWAQELRDTYEAIEAGRRMNKVHWNTVVLDGSVPDDLIEEMIDHSYERVIENLPPADRERLLKNL